MKSRSTTTIFLFLAMIVFGSGASLRACNLSDVSFCGLGGPLLNTAFPSDIMYCVTVCTGYGRTGFSKGADGDTRSIMFGWYSSTPLVVRAFTPATVTSGRGFSNCTMAGANIGAQGAPLNTQGTVIYIDPGYYGLPPCVTQPFGCVTSTALCGNVAQQCITYQFQFDHVPDSLRVFGVEGSGNPVAGCTYQPDMGLRMISLAVTWGALEAVAAGSTVKVKWETLHEENTDFFVVQRANGAAFEDLGNVPAAGFSNQRIAYDFTDLSPRPGTNRYRILQLDRNGDQQFSSVMEVSFDGPSGFALGSVGPNPATDFLNVGLYTSLAEPVLLSLYDTDGKAVIQQSIRTNEGANSIRVDLSQINAGVYFLNLQGSEGKLTRKIVVL